jgi:hypothetical protein
MMSKLKVLIGVSAIAAVGLGGIGSAYADGPGGTFPTPSSHSSQAWPLRPRCGKSLLSERCPGRGPRLT